MKKLKYCTKEQVKELFELGYPLTEVPIDNEGYSKPVYYTEEPVLDTWADCDAYYYPYLEEVARWFIEECDVYLAPSPGYSNELFADWCYYIIYNLSETDRDFEIGNGYDDYNDAFYAGIDKVIEYLKNSKKEHGQRERKRTY